MQNAASRSDIQFWFQNRLISVTAAGQKTVLRWLREDQGLTGTKEGCGEGDCGACTVAVGTLGPSAPQGLRLRAVNSCLLFLPALDGKALFTVEDVAGTDLHPVQRALVDLHASQCGFCTPGFVMSLWADYEERTNAPTREEATSTLSGNLCRCTGYRPILDAAVAAWDHPVRKLDRAPAVGALQGVASAPALTLTGPENWWVPRTLSDLCDLALAHPQARLLAGGTDVGLWVTKGLKNLGDVILVTAVTELKTISDEGDLVIGAAVTLTDAWQALVKRHPTLEDFSQRFASRPIRNAGTLGGNVANGSPIGDSLPVLMALDARVVLRHGQQVREVLLAEFYPGYQKTLRQAGEVITALRLPRLPAGEVRAYKVSKRRDQDISAVCAAFWCSRAADGTLRELRAAFGGLAAVATRAQGVEVALIGNGDSGSWDRARAAVAQQFTPLTDGRATADYRLTVATNLLTRWQAECAAGGQS